MTELNPPLEGYSIYDPIDPFENLSGPFFWRQREDGSHHFIVEAAERHCNRQGAVHGGMLMTMIDLTFAAAAKEYREQRLVTISLTSEFVAAGQRGQLLEATAEITRRTRSLCFMRGQVTSGDQVLLNSSCIYKYLRAR